MVTLHIYAQEFWHTPAYLVGTREALTLLRDALDAAITTGQGQQVKCFVCDGEGYSVEVIVASDKQINKLFVPYTEAEAHDYDPQKVGPWTLIS